MSAVTVLSWVLIFYNVRPRGCTRLPPVPVDDLVERPPVRPDERSKPAVGWVAQTDQVCAEVTVGKPEHAPRLLLVGHCGVTGADAEVGGGQHDVRRRLPEGSGQVISMPGM